ncbi:unnamed protein product [Tuber melanosporum]|uniref:(Perigord truffle) hypothetical protein n=1 Tax=Tuber melanosporum (strain Mel28) TaxID=656061 RepID=D5GKV5_TUBMM|nr:uncharacterized protein GSTUM_00009785001 [Tuber melanosporum]CAZ85148.1 unnamed protein product [Tuber melanosporum]
MSFGFSVGDFIAISCLILNLVDALDSDTGSRAQYSRLSDELKSLHSAFLAVQDVVQKLRRGEKSHASTVNAITYEVECCRKLILGFTAGTEKYRESLCHGGSGRKVKDAWRKISYKIFKEEDVVMLKDSLRRRVEAINILLMVAGIRSVFSLENKVSDMELAICLQQPKIPKNLYPGIEGSIVLQDALGRTFPVPFVICSTLEMFHGFLELSFRGLPGHQKVLLREYSVSDGESQKEITSTEWVENITPGRLISMSMLFRHMDSAPKVTDFKSKCPSCGTPGAFSAAGSSRRWIQCKLCQLWAQHSKECPVETPIRVLEPRYDKPLSPSDASPSSLPPPDVSTISKELSSFRRVKIVEVSQVSYLSALRTAKELANDRKLCQELLRRLRNIGDARFVETKFLDESIVCECPCDELVGRRSHLDAFFPAKGRISEIA